MTIVVPGLLLLFASKFFLGFCLGFGLPAANAIVAESCPPGHRSNIYCMTMVLFSLGQLYSAAVVWIINPSLAHNMMHWREMLACAAMLPLVLLILAFFFLLESPHWLMLNGRVSEAREVVSTMLRYKIDEGRQEFILFSNQTFTGHFEQLPENVTNCHCLNRTNIEHSENFEHPEGDQQSEGDTPSTGRRVSSEILTAYETASKRWEDRAACFLMSLREVRRGIARDFSRLRGIFSRSYRLTTFIMLYVALAANFAYYGMIYGLPDTLKRAKVREGEGSHSWSPAAGLFVSAISEIPGAFLAVILAATIGRRTNMSFAFFGCAASLFSTVTALKSGRITENVGLLSVFGVKVFLASGYIIAYLYLLECYPTKFRATGLAVCMVLGRLGAAACPFLYDGLTFWQMDDVIFFMVMACMMTLASLVCCFLPYETKDTVLEEFAPPGTCTPVTECTPLLTMKVLQPEPEARTCQDNRL